MDGGIEGLIADNRVMIDGKFAGYITTWRSTVTSDQPGFGFPFSPPYNPYRRVELIIHLDPSRENIPQRRSDDNDRRLDPEL